jgi:hypothetical protein
MLIKATHRLEIAANSPLFEIPRVLARLDHVALEGAGKCPRCKSAFCNCQSKIFQNFPRSFL